MFPSYLETFIKSEITRQQSTLNLIASENYPSPKVLEYLGSVWSNKYAEGYPGKRYYAGCENADMLESYVQHLALSVFDKTYSGNLTDEEFKKATSKYGEYAVNVQVLSGSPANQAVYLTVLNPGDTVLTCKPDGGGHISHLPPTSSLNKFYNTVHFNVKDDYEIDLDDYRQKLIDYQPKLVILGFSSYPLQYNFDDLIALVRSLSPSSLVLADIAHINGLVASGLHSSPFDAGADFVTMTTHKTLRGPRGAILFMKKEFEKEINKTIFPGMQGGPHLNKIAAIGQCLEEILGMQKYPDGRGFKEYSEQILKNVTALETGLRSRGFEPIVASQNHLTVIKLPENMDSFEAQQMLEAKGIICNRNIIPNDQKTPWKPSGLRLGMAALTSRGIDEEHSADLGYIIGDILMGRDSTPAKLFKNEITRTLKFYY